MLRTKYLHQKRFIRYCMIDIREEFGIPSEWYRSGNGKDQIKKRGFQLEASYIL